MRRVFPILILVAVVSAGFYLYHRLKREPVPRNEVLLSGNVEAHESQVSFKVQGRIVALPVEEGQAVNKNDLLAQLDDADFRQRVAIDEANVRVRESNLALTTAGTREQEINAAQQGVVDAEAELSQRKLDNERAEQLFAKDEISAQDRDRAATALKRADAAFKTAQQRYELALEGSRIEEIALARANLNQAHANLGLSLVNQSYTKLRAPSNGIVTVRQAELGEVVAPGTPIVSLADLDHVWVRGYVAETDLGRIRWGQAAVITTDTYPGKQYSGRISFISPDAEFTPKSVQTYKERVTLVYRVKIDVENPNHELKPGMPADAHLQFLSATTSTSSSAKP